MIDIILVIISLIWLIFASLEDIKTREVPDWISYSLITIALAFYLIKSIIFNDVSFIIQSLFGLGVFFFLGNLMYYMRQWGGGDVKLFSCLGALFPLYPRELLNYFNPNLQLPFLLILIINIVIFGALYSLIYGLYLIIKNKNRVKFNFKINKLYAFLALILSLITLFLQDLILRMLILLLAFLILVYPYMKNFIHIIEHKIMTKRISLDKLTEGDWVIKDIYYKGKLIYNKNNPGVTNLDIKLFEKIKLKKVWIKEGIPFIPSFLVALIISLIFGNLLLF
ncbi:MAG: prepilin peptidase [Nanoarchaeota archaeon]